MKCCNHPEEEAIGACVTCSRPVCEECAVEVEGKLECRDCLASGNVQVASSGITDNDKMMALLSYIAALIVPLIILLSETSKDRQFQRYHAVHSLAVSALWLVVSLVGCLLSLVPVVGICFSIALVIIPYVPMIYLGVQAYQGRYVEIPVLSDFLARQGWV